MNKYLQTGLLMELVQIILLGIFAVIYALLLIQWTLAIIGITIFCIFNVISITFIIIGFVKGEQC